MLTISASRELAMNLNTPFTLSIKLDMVEVNNGSWTGGSSGNIYSYSDLVFVSVV